MKIVLFPILETPRTLVMCYRALLLCIGKKNASFWRLGVVWLRILRNFAFAKIQVSNMQ